MENDSALSGAEILDVAGVYKTIVVFLNLDSPSICGNPPEEADGNFSLQTATFTCARPARDLVGYFVVRMATRMADQSRSPVGNAHLDSSCCTKAAPPMAGIPPPPPPPPPLPLSPFGIRGIAPFQIPTLGVEWFPVYTIRALCLHKGSPWHKIVGQSTFTLSPPLQVIGVTPVRLQDPRLAGKTSRFLQTGLRIQNFWMPLGKVSEHCRKASVGIESNAAPMRLHENSSA